jgi:hypothetical protein
MAHQIRYITKTSLWTAWKAIRKQLHNSSVRDVVDHLEYDIDPNVWIQQLLEQIRRGTYEPSSPRRFTLAKSKGFSRRMTVPSIQDLVLYRAIVDYLYKGIKGHERKHVYFEQRTLSRVASKNVTAAQRHMSAIATEYPLRSYSRFLAWLKYDQYRKYLIFEEIHPFIVTTDITNFFDTVLYSRIADVFYGGSLPPRMIGLLFFLLERLSIREPYSESPRIGLPVDEFDCSRKLAHMILFPHDARMTAKVGEDSYARWMDDQLVAVTSREQGYKIIGQISESISRLYLSPNAAKTRVLSLSEARRHFHLDINKALDLIESLPYATKLERKIMGTELRKVWKRYKKHEGTGEWSKILKRIYRLAGRSQGKFFRRRALRDIMEMPLLAKRIADYVRCTGSVKDYVNFAQKVWGNTRQLYPDVNLILVESLLRVEADSTDAPRVRSIASNLLRGRLKIEGSMLCAEVAPLLILRFGDRRSLPLLRSSFERRTALSSGVTRAASIVYASYGLEQFRTVRRFAAKEFRNNLAELVRLVERIRDYETVPGSYKGRLTLRYDSVAGHQFVDTRSLVAGRLLLLNTRSAVRSWVASQILTLSKQPISLYDRVLLNRLLSI